MANGVLDAGLALWARFSRCLTVLLKPTVKDDNNAVA